MSRSSYEDHGVISSFVIRFYPRRFDDVSSSTSWRIKVKHIQANEEVSFTTLEQAVKYMRQRLEE